MPLWASDLIRVPGLGLKLLSGNDGLDQRGAITWAHAVDVPDPTPWMSGGELILGTRRAFGEQADECRSFVERIAEAGATGLCISTRLFEDLAGAILEVCDEQLLPLLLCPDDVPLLAVASTVAEKLSSDTELRLTRALNLNRTVVDAVVGERGARGVLTIVGRALEDCTLVAYEYSGEEIARFDPAKRLDELPEDEVWAVLRDGGNDLRGYGVESDRVERDARLEAVVALIADRQVDPFEKLIFQQAVSGIAMDFAREDSRRSARRKRVARLLDGSLARSIPAARLAEGFGVLGMTPRVPWHLVCIAGAESSAQGAVATAVEDAFSDSGPPIVCIFDQFVVVFAPATKDFFTILDDTLGQLAHLRLKAGVSRVKRQVQAVPAGYREASVAVRMGSSRVNPVDALGVNGLVAGLREELGGTELVNVVLGPLADDEKNAGLLETLRLYLANACRSGPTSTGLKIHRHTLTYRLDRITTLTGMDPRMGENLLAFALAVELLDQP